MPQRQVKCRPYIKFRAKPYIKFSARTSTTWTVSALCNAYNWPSKLLGGGVIAIVELGGGWVQSDMQQYFSSINQPVPGITDVSVDGTVNSQQNPQNDADMEVALDIQVAAAAYYMATGKPATIRVYWAQDIAPAVKAAMVDGCDVCTISWGADEAEWGAESCYEMQGAATAAVTKGMQVFAAAGDNDSSDGGPDSANVDCPGSCPSVVCCGGTTKTSTSEVVWNSDPSQMNGEGTGGGYSEVFGMPGWQSAYGAPTAPPVEPDEKNPGKGRMVPDVCANADPDTGYQIMVYGEVQIVGGTSAVAPLYAGLFASFGRKLGFVGERMWITANQKAAFNDIVIGGNGDFSATAGPDPASGLGSPIGIKLAAIFAR